MLSRKAVNRSDGTREVEVSFNDNNQAKLIADLIIEKISDQALAKWISGINSNDFNAVINLVANKILSDIDKIDYTTASQLIFHIANDYDVRLGQGMNNITPQIKQLVTNIPDMLDISTDNNYQILDSEEEDDENAPTTITKNYYRGIDNPFLTRQTAKYNISTTSREYNYYLPIYSASDTQENIIRNALLRSLFSKISNFETNSLVEITQQLFTRYNQRFPYGSFFASQKGPAASFKIKNHIFANNPEILLRGYRMFPSLNKKTLNYMYNKDIFDNSKEYLKKYIALLEMHIVILTQDNSKRLKPILENIQTMLLHYYFRITNTNEYIFQVLLSEKAANSNYNQNNAMQVGFEALMIFTLSEKTLLNSVLNKLDKDEASNIKSRFYIYNPFNCR
ncbi:MAG: hypothetical protein KIT27_07780 [Legionellales bacterium]|nr:hypothetical protein [Legionellales bacterium]